MEKFDIYKDVASRTDGDIYVGVVGPVRTGKSTFITKFMDLMVTPNIQNKNKRQIAIDEMPQSGSGKTITTTEDNANRLKLYFPHTDISVITPKISNVFSNNGKMKKLIVNPDRELIDFANADAKLIEARDAVKEIVGYKIENVFCLTLCNDRESEAEDD